MSKSLLSKTWKKLLYCTTLTVCSITFSLPALQAQALQSTTAANQAEKLDTNTKVGEKNNASQALPDIKKVGPVYTFKLDNGMEVVVIENHRAPVVTQMVWYKTGSADEPRGVTGIAHFLEHLMFKGTANHPDGEFTKMVAKIGGEQNAFTYYDYTAYYQSVAPEFLPQMMEFEADRMTNLILNDDAIDSERKVIIEERRMRTDNNPAAILGEQTRAALFLNSPYHNPVIGWKQEMEQLSKEDAIAFYKQYYTPNNAILVLSGDITPQKARELAVATYGKIEPRSDVGPRIRPQEPKTAALRTVTMHDARVSVPQLQHMWVVPSYNNAQDKKQAASLDLLGEILGSAPLGRLYQQFIVKEGSAAAVGAGYDGSALDDGVFYFYIVPRGDAKLEDLEKAIQSSIENIAKNGVSEAELNQARNRFMKDMIFSMDSPVGMAQMYGAALSVGMSAEDVAKWPELLKSITPEDVQKAAQKYLSANNGVSSYLLPPPLKEDHSKTKSANKQENEKK